MRRAVLALFAFLVLIPCIECAAQAPPSAAPPDLEEFLATLSGGQSTPPATEMLSPTLDFQYITCSSNEQCPQGQLCCYPCGIDGCDFICMDPDRRGRCPIIA